MCASSSSTSYQYQICVPPKLRRCLAPKPQNLPSLKSLTSVSYFRLEGISSPRIDHESFKELLKSTESLRNRFTMHNNLQRMIYNQKNKHSDKQQLGQQKGEQQHTNEDNLTTDENEGSGHLSDLQQEHTGLQDHLGG